MKIFLRWLLALSFLLTNACGQSQTEEPPTQMTAQEVVYGSDDRLEYYEVDAEMQALARAVVTFVGGRSLDEEGGGALTYVGETLGESEDLCPGERFADQPTASGCSASLIDERLVMTAGHCVGGNSCPNTYFGFGYYYESPGVFPRITLDDLYECNRVVAYSNGRGGDYAVLELDRAVTFADPLDVDTSGVARGDELILMGFPSTIPLKIASDATVVQGSDGTQFGGTVDAFSGNSGSAVLGADGRAVGILVAGNEDYAYDRSSGCYRVNELPQSGSSGAEQITDIRLVISALCEGGYPSERLCGVFGECGDGFCTGDETPDSCPDDCEAGPTQPPPAWTCDAGWYGVGDDCDCGCGAYDPDCDNPDLEILNCEAGEVCNAAGECQGSGGPNGWTCDLSYYAAGDDCDCNCGIFDPDCDDPNLAVVNCQEGQICNASGLCADPTAPGPDTGVPDAGVDVGPEPEDVLEADGVSAPDGGADPGGVTTGDSGAIYYPTDSSCSSATSKPAPLALLFLGLVAARRRRSA